MLALRAMMDPALFTPPAGATEEGQSSHSWIGRPRRRRPLCLRHVLVSSSP
jgi:hypothetical protein